MSTPFAKALLGGPHLVMRPASFAVPARAQTVCAWPDDAGTNACRRSGRLFHRIPNGTRGRARPYVPGDFSPDAESTVHSGPTH